MRRLLPLMGAVLLLADSLGEALEAAGQLEAARDSYKRAIELSTGTGRAHPAFQQNLERVLLKLAWASGDGTP